ncbi:MAG TPA: hypothetical protein VGN00_04700 [Puia sp.]|jgi:hypothetical protein
MNSNTHIIDGYMSFLDTLSPGAKLDLIAKLTQSLKSELKPKEGLIKSSFGAWSGAESAQEIVKGIRDSRSINREIEEL